MVGTLLSSKRGRSTCHHRDEPRNRRAKQKWPVRKATGRVTRVTRERERPAEAQLEERRAGERVAVTRAAGGGGPVGARGFHGRWEPLDSGRAEGSRLCGRDNT